MAGALCRPAHRRRALHLSADRAGQPAGGGQHGALSAPAADGRQQPPAGAQSVRWPARAGGAGGAAAAGARRPAPPAAGRRGGGALGDLSSHHGGHSWGPVCLAGLAAEILDSGDAPGCDSVRGRCVALWTAGGSWCDVWQRGTRGRHWQQ